MTDHTYSFFFQLVGKISQLLTCKIAMHHVYCFIVLGTYMTGPKGLSRNNTSAVGGRERGVCKIMTVDDWGEGGVFGLFNKP